MKLDDHSLFDIATHLETIGDVSDTFLLQLADRLRREGAEREKACADIATLRAALEDAKLGITGLLEWGEGECEETPPRWAARKDLKFIEAVLKATEKNGPSLESLGYKVV